jgi:hypothetical protein
LVDQAQRLVEGLDDLRGEDVGADRLVGAGDAVGQRDREIHLADPLGDLEQVADAGRGRGGHRAPVLRDICG